MKKSNPLFVDTTKFNGDSLFTQVELNGIPPYVGTVVSIRVIDKAGAEQIVELERAKPTQCTGQVFLTYRQEITYSFFVSRNGSIIFEMTPKQGMASYLIQDVWAPISLHKDILEEQFAEAAPEQAQEPIQAQEQAQAETPEKTETLDEEFAPVFDSVFTPVSNTDFTPDPVELANESTGQEDISFIEDLSSKLELTSISGSESEPKSEPSSQELPESTIECLEPGAHSHEII